MRPTVIDEHLEAMGPDDEGQIIPIDNVGVTPDFTTRWVCSLRTFDRTSAIERAA